MVELAVVIPYFNPAGYVSHERKLARTLAAFRAVGLAGDVHLTGAGGSRPLDAQVAFWDADCPYLWHKERLINLAVSRLPARYTHVVWSDSDIIVDEDWADAVADAFRTAAVVQCFRTARYRDTAGHVSMTRSSALLPGERGAMGLVWGADRSLFADGPGLFEHAVVGGGDSILGRAIRVDHKTPSVPWLARHRHMLSRTWSPELLAEQDAWVAATAHWLTDRGVAAAAADIQVLEHGPRAQRRYNDRHALLADFSPADHLVDEPGRVLRWTPAAADLEPAVRAYFHSRGEDDPSHIPAPDIPAAHAAESAA
ncbi:hypothetical protein LO772_14665 [Yinghuangia sp. ASG 101]|uniref:hypothetical protein n=1 Tax=Yinghuangia sp. ASG 101 TaxID=2896848 RepID=UPI001E4BE632|nr:hypothetical protein [Yinghuangia sp. ASG 101]UGQ14708.1 hypothetical protein LO772_14665 [Yinghuangia sp. ASG 101]